jgi:hypothetical protein
VVVEVEIVILILVVLVVLVEVRCLAEQERHQVPQEHQDKVMLVVLLSIIQDQMVVAAVAVVLVQLESIVQMVDQRVMAVLV